ncbi:MAG: 1-acyl-sn-glycerol-3-phosphate acyltransferase [Methylococcaceae bacterium]|nr:1-acyl-sn-glycerol-3-phosphate acyltransferase [Prolixibacteraceae bacterium]
MIAKMNFDDIRPFNDSEVEKYIQLLLQDPYFNHILEFIFKVPEKVNYAKSMLLKIQTVRDLQHSFMYKLIEELILKPTTDGLTSSGLEHLEKDKSYLFISNHRDIILDSALLNYLIVDKGMNTTEVAIGNNLLIDNWIEYAVKLNRAFVVRRNLPVRELLMASKKLSEYIRRDIKLKNTSVWIAQREGRTKDGNDKTQTALLKMLNLSNINEFSEGFKELRIVPLSISYEIEPCGTSKVEEIYKRKTEGYEKTPKDDLRSMGHGLVNPKGRVHFAFGEPLNGQIDLFSKETTLGEQIERLGDYIDQQIYLNFKLWPNNYIAYDLLNESTANSKHYTQEEYQKFGTLIETAVNEIEGDKETIRSMFLQMYANPVINKKKSSEVTNV